MFLTHEDLRILTGYSRHTKQAEWLTRHGIPFRVNARGFPVVERDALKPSKQVPELGVVR